jgi:hypothetical protein
MQPSQHATGPSCTTCQPKQQPQGGPHSRTSCSSRRCYTTLQGKMHLTLKLMLGLTPLQQQQQLLRQGPASRVRVCLMTFTLGQSRQQMLCRLLGSSAPPGMQRRWEAAAVWVSAVCAAGVPALRSICRGQPPPSCTAVCTAYMCIMCQGSDVAGDS